jgi:uncharacterized protein (DUF924 family)|tara:strand:+ start:78 stop:641 length:564 start_codon:yes stop_codon:yes gene_type:complete
MTQDKYQSILTFWFNESSVKNHWSKNDEYDQKIKEKFLKDLERAIQNKYDDWQDYSKSSLALIILLDQFSRNVFRNDSRSYAQDTKSRLLVTEGVDREYLDELDLPERLFYLMPLVHSEEMQDHLFVKQLGEVFLRDHPNYLEIKKSWESHSTVIKKFGRYPHRNEILQRQSTLEEIAFLKEPNSSW